MARPGHQLGPTAHGSVGPRGNETCVLNCPVHTSLVRPHGARPNPRTSGSIPTLRPHRIHRLRRLVHGPCGPVHARRASRPHPQHVAVGTKVVPLHVVVSALTANSSRRTVDGSLDGVESSRNGRPDRQSRDPPEPPGTRPQRHDHGGQVAATPPDPPQPKRPREAAPPPSLDRGADGTRDQTSPAHDTAPTSRAFPRREHRWPEPPTREIPESRSWPSPKPPRRRPTSRRRPVTATRPAATTARTASASTARTPTGASPPA